jgi:hypothetical protein
MDHDFAPKRGGRALAAAVAVVLGVGGCDSVPRVEAWSAGTAAPAADPKPMTWGAERADPRAVASAPAALRACMTRNDDVISWRTSGDLLDKTRWRADHRQDAHARIIRGVHKHLRETRIKTGRRVWSGFMGYDLDPANYRLIMLVDPRVLDIREFRTMVRAVAKKANRDAHVKGRNLTVTTQKGCFSAAEVNRLRAALRENRRVGIMFDAGVKLDGRYYAGFCGDAGRAYARKLQRERGPVLAIVAGSRCGIADGGHARV